MDYLIKNSYIDICLEENKVKSLSYIIYKNKTQILWNKIQESEGDKHIHLILKWERPLNKGLYLFLKKYKFIYFNWRLITLQYCMAHIFLN